VNGRLLLRANSLGGGDGHTSEQRELPQAGLPQGSPLSPVSFLFFNAYLVQRRIKAERGSIAFVNDYSGDRPDYGVEPGRHSANHYPVARVGETQRYNV
jgi:hypothetical protein